MKLKFEVDPDDVHELEMSFDDLVLSQLQKEILNRCKRNLESDKFKKFVELAADKLTVEIKLKLENFLSEDIALNDRWGKPIFIGSIEDLMKKRFDDLLLHPVDNSGNRLEGCTSSSMTWIQWSINKKLQTDVTSIIDREKTQLAADIRKNIKQELIDFKDSALKEQVGEAMASILKIKK
jgi:hypothetical protein